MRSLWPLPLPPAPARVCERPHPWRDQTAGRGAPPGGSWSAVLPLLPGPGHPSHLGLYLNSTRLPRGLTVGPVTGARYKQLRLLALPVSLPRHFPSAAYAHPDRELSLRFLIPAPGPAPPSLPAAISRLKRVAAKRLLEKRLLQTDEV